MIHAVAPWARQRFHAALAIRGVGADVFMGKGREKSVVRHREVIFAAMRRPGPLGACLSGPEIAFACGKGGHATVFTAIRRAQRRAGHAGEVEELMGALRKVGAAPAAGAMALPNLSAPLPRGPKAAPAPRPPAAAPACAPGLAHALRCARRLIDELCDPRLHGVAIFRSQAEALRERFPSGAEFEAIERAVERAGRSEA